MIDNNIIATLWQIVCILFYTTIIIFFVTLIIELISATIENHKKRKAINNAVKELCECIDKIKEEDIQKTIDKKDNK